MCNLHVSHLSLSGFLLPPFSLCLTAFLWPAFSTSLEPSGDQWRGARGLQGDDVFHLHRQGPQLGQDGWRPSSSRWQGRVKLTLDQCSHTWSWGLHILRVAHFFVFVPITTQRIQIINSLLSFYYLNPLCIARAKTKCAADPRSVPRRNFTP